MPKESQPLDKLFSEHGTIGHLIDVASKEMTDIDTFFRLQTESFEWSQTSIKELSARQKELRDTIETLQKTMQAHFSYEEKNLLALIGDLLTKGLKLEHQEIVTAFDMVKSALAKPVSEGLTPPQLLARKASLQQTLEKLTGMIEGHARNEEVILKLLQKVTKG